LYGAAPRAVKAPATLDEEWRGDGFEVVAADPGVERPISESGCREFGFRDSSVFGTMYNQFLR